MRLLAFSDLHRDRDQAERLVELAGEADVVIGAGDFASMHIGLPKMIDTLSAIKAPAVRVPGNNETENEPWRACASWESAAMPHDEATAIHGLHFCGM